VTYQLVTVKVLIFASFEEDVRQRKIVTKDYLCQSLIVVTSNQHVILWSMNIQYAPRLTERKSQEKKSQDKKSQI
jgi:hypothetical protein